MSEVDTRTENWDVRSAAWPVAAVRAAERTAMAALPPGGLMRRAAAGLARRCLVVLADGGGVYGAPVVLLVGGGDNGGDALYAGATLARRGAVVRAIAGVQDERVHRAGAAALRAAGGRLVELAAVRDRPALVVDGLLGIGGRGGLRPDAARLASAAAQWRAAGTVVIAVDLPSGVDPDTGAVPGAAVSADITVAFGSLKSGLLVGDGAVLAGLIELIDIGLEFDQPPTARLVTADAVRRWWPRPGPGDDKYTRGVVGVASGSPRYPGAAVLSTGGALSGPGGYVRYAGAAADAVRAAYPEVVCAASVADAGRVRAWVIGSGLGTDDDAVDAVRRVLATDLPVLLDADGLTIVAEHPDWLRDRAAPTVLTPHDREFARIAGTLGADRLAAARTAALDLGVIVLLKGYRTVVTAGDGPAYVVTAGVPELATAGTGDVLSGVIGSLLAGGVPPVEAAAAGAFVHGTAGRLAAEAGPVVASRVLDALPAAVHTVLA